MDKTNQQTWPPPPALGNPLAAHDALLAALVMVRRPFSQPPITRTRLARLLHGKTGLEPRQCRTFVHDFCERNGILPREGVWARLPFGLALASSVVIPIQFLAFLAYFWMHAHAAGVAARLMLDSKFDHLRSSVFDPWIGLSLVMAVIATVSLLPSRARLRHASEDARRKLTPQ